MYYVLCQNYTTLLEGYLQWEVDTPLEYVDKTPMQTARLQ